MIAPSRSPAILPHRPSLPELPAQFHFTPEFQLLVASSVLARNPMDPSQSGQIRARCAAVADWEAFLALVDRHNLSGPVFAALCRYADGRWPDRIRRKLKERKLQDCACALRHTAELVRLHRQFTDAGIDLISLKGVALSLRLFGDPAMRQVRDIDLLVKPGDVSQAATLLHASGYRRKTISDFTSKVRETLLWQSHHDDYWHHGFQVMVELHWRVNQWAPEQSAELWSQCETDDFMGIPVQQLRREALLLFLCSHGAGHRWANLKWLSDVAMLTMQEPIPEANGLLAMAARLDLEPALAQTALLLYWVYGIRPSQPLCELIQRETQSADLATHALHVALMDQAGVLASAGSVRWKYLRYTLRLRKHLPAHILQEAVSNLTALLQPAFLSRAHSSGPMVGRGR